jgi:hypothetical protein
MLAKGGWVFRHQAGSDLPQPSSLLGYFFFSVGTRCGAAFCSHSRAAPSAQRAILLLGLPSSTRERGGRQGCKNGGLYDDGQGRAAGAGSDRAMHAHLHAIRGGADKAVPRVGRGAGTHADCVAQTAGGATPHLRISALALPADPWPDHVCTHASSSCLSGTAIELHNTIQYTRFTSSLYVCAAGG